MCGIGGFVDFERDARRGGPILHGMKRTLTPRGPDAEGTYFDEDTALIHRRLIVIDPEGGKQPMCSPDRNTILIYNGELYNTPELRTELMSRGHEFVGHSDTEVLLHAYLEWKTDAFARLNGIFAFAIWEKRERRLTLCRDRLGVKPLFFAPIRHGLTFGSTIDTVLCHPEIEPALDEDGLRTLLLLGPARPPESGVFRQIKSLLPGHFAVLTPENFTDHVYWQLEAHEHEDDLSSTPIERDSALATIERRSPASCTPAAGQWTLAAGVFRSPQIRRDWKTDAFARLNGISPLLSGDERRLTLAPRPAGRQTLFGPIRNGLTFGSTIDTVLCHPEIEPALEGWSMLLLGPARPPEVAIRQIKSLLPGHFAVLKWSPHVYFWRRTSMRTTSTDHRAHAHAHLRCREAGRECRWRVSCPADWIRPSCPCWRRKITRPAAKRCIPGRWIIRTTINILQKVYSSPNSAIRIKWWIFSVRHHRVVLEPEAVCAALLPRRRCVRCPAWRRTM